MPDPEIEAMAKVAEAVEVLDEESAQRVLRWAVARFAPTLPSPGARGAGVTSAYELPADDFASLYNAASPANEREKALVAAYWLQRDQGAPDFPSADANSLLRDLGHAVGNITREFDRLQAEKPQLVIQTRKSGSSKQARKLYRITTAGRQRVSEMIEGSD